MKEWAMQSSKRGGHESTDRTCESQMRAGDSGNAGIVDRAVHDVVLRQENRKRHAFFAVDLAHVVMLGEKAIIPQSHAAALVTALRDIYRRDPIEDAADTALS